MAAYSNTHRSLSSLLLLLLVLVSSTPLPSAGDAPTAYDLLEGFGFPKGILPEGVESYLLRPDGSFEVVLAADCDFTVQGYQLKYKKRVTGTVQTGHLRNLGGVSVKVLFAWFGINEVVTGGGELRFYVGPISASFPVDNFDECPRCRCGFNCVEERLSDS